MGFKNYFVKRRSIVFTWLLSYALVLIIPVAIAAVTYIETTHVVEKQINGSNSLLLRKIQQQMDSLIFDAERLSEEIAMNTRINDLLRVRGSAGAVTGYDTYMTIQDLRSFKISNSSIDDYYVYFKNLDLVVSSIASRDSRAFYDAYISNTGIQYQPWHDTLAGTYKANHITVFNLNEMGKEWKTIVFIRTIPFVSQAGTSANIIVTIDESRFMEDAKDIQTSSEGSVLIINRDNEVIASSNPQIGANNIKYEDLKNDSGMLYTNLQGKKYVVSYITSKMDGWKYIAAVPYSMFWEKAEYVRRLTIASLFLCILVGSFITYFSLRKNYNPVIQMIKLLEAKQGLSFDKKNNEYLFIQQVIDKVQADKEKADSILKQQNKELKAEFLSRLLKGKVGGNLPVADVLDHYDIHLKSDFFAVMAFYIEDYDEVFPAEMDGAIKSNSFETFKMVQFIITNVVEEMTGQKGNQGFMIDIDDMLVCLVNFSEENLSDHKEELERVVREAQEFLNKHFNISFMAAVSGMHSTVTSIPGAYSEALQALEYKKVLGVENIIHYQDMVGLPKGDYYYPLEVEQQLINCIKTGDFLKSKNILEDIFVENFQKSILSVKIARCLMFNLVSTMIKTINETNCMDDNFLEDLNPVERLLSCGSIKEMKNEMIEILKIFCSYIKMQSRNKVKGMDQRLVENVINHVQSNYHDANLGVTTIAEKFNVHMVHLSKVFKEHTGEGLLDYISKIRVSKAKALLKESANLDDVAKKVGYTNLRTFTRVFKKYEGITAGRFKELG